MTHDRRLEAIAAANARLASNTDAPLQLGCHEADAVSSMEATQTFERWCEAASQHETSPNAGTRENLERWRGDLLGRLETLAAYDTLHVGAIDSIGTIGRLNLQLLSVHGSTDGLGSTEFEKVCGWLDTISSSERAKDCEHLRHTTVADLLGLDGADVLDGNNEYSPEIVIGAMHGRYPQLIDLLLKLLQPLASNGLQVDRALDAVHHFQLPDGPLRLWAAQQAKMHIVDAHTADAERTTLIMRDLRNRTDTSAANRERLRRTNRALCAARTTTERAELTLDKYRQMVEGQLRPWGWTLARLVGGYEGSMPELGGLLDRLAKADTPATRAVAGTILPMARNAAAHEDYQYDDRRHQLRVGNDSITLEDLEATCRKIVALVSGFELGFGAARADTDELRRDMDEGDLAPPPAELLRRRSMELFATNGLKPLKGERNGGTFSITLETLRPNQINPMLQAVLWSARLQPEMDTFSVSLTGRDHPIAEVHRQVLDRTFPLWSQCRQWFDQMPTGLFAGINAAVRLKSESGPDAVLAAGWIGANDLVHALDDLWEPRLPRTASAFVDLVHRAYVVEQGCRIALEETGNTGAGKLHQVVRRAADLCLAARREDVTGIRRLDDRIRKLQGQFVPVPILPTWSDWTPEESDD